MPLQLLAKVQNHATAATNATVLLRAVAVLAAKVAVVVQHAVVVLAAKVAVVAQAVLAAKAPL